MSLFETKEWWRTDCGTDEKFDRQSLLVVSLLDSKSKDVIVVGSRKGILRIYNPLTRQMNTKLPLDYSSNDLLIEQQLSDSIVDLKIGKFVSGSQDTCLAVLMPERLIVFQIIFTKGLTELDDKCSLNIEYEHQLQSISMSMVVGPFGGVQDRDFICVQFVDGTLLFIEQQLNNFIRTLEKHSQHEPIAYIELTDTFVTHNSDWILAVYRYQKIAESRERNKSIEPNWKYNLGEAIISIESVYLSTMETNIIVVGEKNFYCFHDSHLSVKFMRKIMYNVICTHAYVIEPDGKFFYIVITDKKTVMVYEGIALKWSAKVPFLPVAVTVAHAEDCRGLLVMLSDDGHLEICYFGTQPSLYITPSFHQRRYNYAEAEKEHARLRSLIKKFIHEGPQVPDLMTKSRVKITGEFVDNKSISKNESQIEEIEGEGYKNYNYNLKIESTSRLTNLKIYIEMPKPWSIQKDSYQSSSLYGSSVFELSIDFEGNLPALLMTFNVVVIYEDEQNDIHVIRETLPFNFRMISRICSLQDINNVPKIGIHSNNDIGFIFNELYREITHDDHADKIPDAFSLKLLRRDDIITLAYEATKQQFFVHSHNWLASLSLLNLILHRIPERVSKNLKLYFESNQVNFIKDFMESYMRIRGKFKDVQRDVALLVAQLRNIIKKMLRIRERDSQRAGDDSLSFLLKITCQSISTRIDEFTNCQEERNRAENDLHSALQLVVDFLKFDLDGNTWANLKSSIVFQPQEEDQVVWEDVTRNSFNAIYQEILKELNSVEESSSDKLEIIKNTKQFHKSFLSIINDITMKQKN